jgi:FkbM family methyltransferase
MTAETVTMVPTEINGRWTISLPSYRAERTEWADPGWEVERLASMHANLAPGDVVYDVGTEEGDLSGLYALWGCQLVLVEPNPLAWPNIRAIWEENGFPGPLAWWEGFAADRDAYTAETMTGDGLGVAGWPTCTRGDLIRAHGFSSLREHMNFEGDGRQQIVPRITLDTLARLTGTAPDAVTIDVEGAEMLVLEGAAGLLRDARPLVWVSVHDEMIRYDYGYTAESAHQFMALHGYRMQLLAIDHESHWFYWPAERDVVLP